MAIQFRLPETMRAEHNLPEWVEFDMDTMTIDEAIALDDALGWSPGELLSHQLKPVIDDATGEQAVDPDTGEVRWRRNYRAYKFMIWTAARRSGLRMSYDKFDLPVLSLMAADTEPDAEDDGEDGPDPKETPPASRSTRVNSTGGRSKATGAKPAGTGRSSRVSTTSGRGKSGS